MKKSLLDLAALDAALQDPAPSPTAPKAPLSEFEEDPNQPRFEFDDPEFEHFVDDVRERGILQPVIVRVNEATGKLRIRFGARRFRAALRLELAELPYLITEDERHFDDYAQVSENERRQGLQPLELATFIAKKIADGAKKKTIAAKLKIDAGTVTNLLALVDAPPFILELYHSRKCRSPRYLYDLRKLHEQNAEIVERRCAEVDEIDRRLLVSIAEEIEPPKTPPADAPTSVKDVLDSTATSPVAGSGGTSTANPKGGGVQAQQLPPHNPAIEKESGGKASDPNKLKKPLLLGTYKGRAVMIVLTQRPTTAGLIVIRFEDGTGDKEVPIGDIVLTMLSDSHHQA
jgi:ParB family chromosome partitioning protein